MSLWYSCTFAAIGTDAEIPEIERRVRHLLASCTGQ